MDDAAEMNCIWAIRFGRKDHADGKSQSNEESDTE